MRTSNKKQTATLYKSASKPDTQKNLSATINNKASLSAVGSTVAKGLSRLVLGQQRFAEEFGLSTTRVFPQSQETIQGKDIENLIAKCLCSDEGKDLLEQLFNDLITHQIALISALDGIALQTLAEINSIEPTTNVVSHLLKKVGIEKKQKRGNIEDLQQNQKLRHQKVVAPGFVNVYTRSRESLQK